MMMTTENDRANTAARAEIYRSLAECYHPPDGLTGQYAGELKRRLGEVCAAATEASGSMEAALENGEGPAERAIDYARLFVGPFALLAPPYGSVYLDGDRRVMGASTAAAEACYREAGLSRAPDFHDAPDHIAAELEFLYFLVLKELEAQMKSPEDQARGWREKQIGFLAEHLAAWVPQFAQKVEGQSQTRFYRELARVTRMWVAEDFEACREGGRRCVAEGPEGVKPGTGAAGFPTADVGR